MATPIIWLNAATFILCLRADYLNVIEPLLLKYWWL